MIWNLIGTIGGKVLYIVDNVVEDKDEANQLKFQIQRLFGHQPDGHQLQQPAGRIISGLTGPILPWSSN